MRGTCSRLECVRALAEANTGAVLDEHTLRYASRCRTRKTTVRLVFDQRCAACPAAVQSARRSLALAHVVIKIFLSQTAVYSPSFAPASINRLFCRERRTR